MGSKDKGPLSTPSRASRLANKVREHKGIRDYPPLKIFVKVGYLSEEDIEMGNIDLSYSPTGILLEDPSTKLYDNFSKDDTILACDIHVLGYSPLDFGTVKDQIIKQAQKNVSQRYAQELRNLRGDFEGLGIDLGTIDPDNIKDVFRELDDDIYYHRVGIFNRKQKSALKSRLRNKFYRLDRNLSIAYDAVSCPENYHYHEVPGANEVLRKIREIEEQDEMGVSEVNIKKVDDLLEESYNSFMKAKGLVTWDVPKSTFRYHT